MTLEEIRAMPTSWRKATLREDTQYHEGFMRSFNILAKVVELLEAGTPGKVVMEIILDLRSSPGKEF